MILYAVGALAGLLMFKRRNKGKGKGRRQVRKYGFVWKGRVRTFTTLARAQHRLHELRSGKRR